MVPYLGVKGGPFLEGEGGVGGRWGSQHLGKEF